MSKERAKEALQTVMEDKFKWARIRARQKGKEKPGEKEKEEEEEKEEKPEEKAEAGCPKKDKMSDLRAQLAMLGKKADELTARAAQQHSPSLVKRVQAAVFKKFPGLKKRHEEQEKVEKK